MKRSNGGIDLSLDYHAHVLPGCDHGSDRLETSLRQLDMAAAAGIRTVCATPHFYPHKESAESFLRRRAECAQLLRAHLPERAPQICLGAEVLICDGMERLDGLYRLCREGTNELLLEMPFYAWPESIWDTLYQLLDLQDIQIILAHAERYPAADIEQLARGVRGAVLTLSSGENVALEAGGRRMLVEQDGTRLEIAGEELAYHKVEAEQEIPMTNTVTVPRGKEFSLRLSDGTQVWLNSESSLVFPVRFGDGPREVTVTGEAYFDVAHDASRRFVVHADTVSVSVYGTAFNISSYADEGAIETTLVRGSVEVRSGHRRAMLQPGQQARVGREGAIFDVRQVAAEDYAAWTRGLFTFNDETIASICRKLSRWYGVEIVPRGVDADKVRYTGVVKRYETFAEMARLLARTDQIRADVEEGKIVLCIDRDND